MRSFIDLLWNTANVNMEGLAASVHDLLMHSYDVLVRFLVATKDFALEQDMVELLDLATHAISSLAGV